MKASNGQSPHQNQAPLPFGALRFTLKADLECAIDGLTRDDVIESVLSAQFVRVKKSTSPLRKSRREQIFIIDSFNYVGTLIYSKGVIRRLTDDEAEYYILISGKRSIRSG